MDGFTYFRKRGEVFEAERTGVKTMRHELLDVLEEFEEGRQMGRWLVRNRMAYGEGVESAESRSGTTTYAGVRILDFVFKTEESF